GDNCEEINKTATTFFQGMINSIEIFTGLNKCVDFLTDLNDTTIFLIVSREIDQQDAVLLESLSQVKSIYVLHCDKTKNKQSIPLCKKVRGIYTNMKSMCETLKEDIRHSNRNLIPMNVISQTSAINLDELDPAFMYSQLLKEIILDMPHDDNEKKILVNFSTKKYADSHAQMAIITEFDQQYDKPSPV
ncbi:unnamed protein product, partial [Rotaria magnacalcarata]